jgi:hypothetical protein
MEVLMSNKIVVKKGEKYILACATHDPRSRVEEEFIAEDDMSEEELENEAEEFFWNNKEPCWWWDKGE